MSSSAFEVERKHALEDLGVGEVGWPAVSGEDGSVEGGVGVVEPGGTLVVEVGSMLAGSLILVWFGLAVQAANRRHLVEWTTDLRLLDSAEFEWLVGEVFRREGWKVEETGRRDGPDGNVDLRLTKDGKPVLVQMQAMGVVGGGG